MGFVTVAFANFASLARLRVVVLPSTMTMSINSDSETDEDTTVEDGEGDYRYDTIQSSSQTHASPGITRKLGRTPEEVVAIATTAIRTLMDMPLAQLDTV